MVLTRQEKESLVIDLYNQGKNTREIAQQVGMSFRDIGAILQKEPRRRKKIIIFLFHLRLMQCFPRENLRSKLPLH